MCQDHRLLQGAIDTNIHASPILFPRVCDHAEPARGAAATGLRLFVRLMPEHGVRPAEIEVMIRRAPARAPDLRVGSQRRARA